MHQLPNAVWRAIVAIAVALSVGSAAEAQEGARSLAKMTGQADLVFRGVVVRVEYALSSPSEPGEPALPHTFVTYRVDEVLHGKVSGPSLTLRFLGGLDERTGLYLRTSD